MDIVNYALSKRMSWNDLKDKPFYDASWELDTSDVLETNDINSGTGFVLVSNNPDDFNNNENIKYYCKYGGFEYELTHDIWAVDNCEEFYYYYNDDESKKTTVAYVVTSENTPINVYDVGTKYFISNPSVGAWVKHNPQSKAIASIYTKEIHQIDPKFIPPSIMTVTVTEHDDGSLSADKTFEEISEAYKAGKVVQCGFFNIIMPLSFYDENVGVIFYKDDIVVMDAQFLNIYIDVDNYISAIDGSLILQGSTSTKNGLPGLVPVPSAGDQDKFLKGDGTWGELPLSFNDSGELVVTLNGISKTFVPKS